MSHPITRHAFFMHRHIVVIAALLAVMLSLPMLSNGLFLDDYHQRLVMMGGGDANAFDFFTRGNAVTEAQLQSGVLPWWIWDEAKTRFYRPLAQWLMSLDFALWPDSLVLMHLHSVLWYGLLTLIAGLTYRELMPARWAAGLAAVLFAIDSGHAGAVAWLANRNVLICMATGLLCLLCHRRQGLAWQLAGWALFTLGMAAGESALAITGYLFAHEVFLSDRPWRTRIGRLLPYALIAVAWMAWWRHGGYGTAGPGFYIDPGRDPGLFLQEMVYRVPAYLVGQFFVPSADIMGLLQHPPLRFYALTYSVLVLMLLGWLFRPLLRSSRLARFYALGMLIAVIPICGSAVVGRALWYVGFGATGLLALYIHQSHAVLQSPRQARAGRLFVTLMLMLHLWLSPLFYVGYAKALDFFDGLMDTQTVHLPNTGAPGRQLLLVSSLGYVGNVTFPLLKDQALSLGTQPTRPPPAITKVRGLVEGEGEFVLQRPGPDTLVVRSTTAFTTLRSSRYGFAAGDQVALDDVAITVRSVSPQGAPVDIVYQFHPGALAGYEVMAWQHDRFEPALLPAVGGSQRLRIEKAF